MNPKFLGVKISVSGKLETLRQLWEKIENWERCGDCPLKKINPPLLFKPERLINAMVITEGPNQVMCKKDIASLAAHPTFTYLMALAGGKFIPEGKEATVYWTHVRKCFIKNGANSLIKKSEEAEVLDKCSANYLYDEIKALEPKIIVAVGWAAKDRFNYGLDKDKLEDLIEKQARDKRPLEVSINRFTTKVAVVPHPSPRNRYWVKQDPQKTKDALEMVRSELLKIM